MRNRRSFVAMIVAVAMLTVVGAALAAPPPKGKLFHNGGVVGTVVLGAVAPGSGTDPFYAVMGGVEGQLGIAGVAPGDGPYHGGKWAFNAVTWNVAPEERYLLKSDEAVWAAEMAGHVTVTRVHENDFRCPVTSTAVAG